MKSKTLGLIATIAAIFSRSQSLPEGMNHSDLNSIRVTALTNGGRAPIPSKMLNQRQKRKLNRQTNNYK
jgi:hypothetical protein